MPAISHFRLTEEYYYELIVAYPKRAMTFPSDKPPAISALAKALSNKLAEENASPKCLVGLWEMNLLQGLMWEAVWLYATHVVPYRAPSWSWTATDSQITFVRRYGWDWSWDLRVVSCELCPLSLGYPFGEVKNGRLVVEGRTIPLIRSRQVVITAAFESRSIGWCEYDECLDGENPYNSAPRISSTTKNKKRSLLTLNENASDSKGFDSCNGGELRIDEPSFRGEEYKATIIRIVDLADPREKKVEGILVQRRAECEEYERVGCLTRLVIPCTWLDSIERERLVII